MKKNIKKIIGVILSMNFILTMSISVFAKETPFVWAYNEADNGYISAIENQILTHIPQSTIRAFNAHQGQVVISAIKCDELGIAGITNGEPTKTGWYMWPNGKVYVDLTPSYGLPLMQQTVLHEFGHVFDMERGATNNTSIQLILRSELPSYNALEANTGYMIPPMKDEHELFAQVFAAVVSNNDGTVRYSKEIMEVCPGTTNYIKGLLGK